MSALDPEDTKRGNRASVGQLLHLLKDEKVRSVLTSGGRRKGTHGPTVDALRSRYKCLLKSDEFTGGRQLRNNKISHVLLQNTPTVEYADV